MKFISGDYNNFQNSKPLADNLYLIFFHFSFKVHFEMELDKATVVESIEDKQTTSDGDDSNSEKEMEQEGLYLRLDKGGKECNVSIAWSI